MVHDRRIEGKTYTFGNQGGLFMNAMTWWDHETESVWSQVWGQAIAGKLKGVTLKLIPAAIVPWSTWKEMHPQTQAMITAHTFFGRRERPQDDWVIGVAIGEHRRAYYYEAVAEAGVINDILGPYPLAIYANEETRDIQVFLRQINEEVVWLQADESGRYLQDKQGENQWAIHTGFSQRDQPLSESLPLIPYISAYDWAWKDFHPRSDFYPYFAYKK